MWEVSALKIAASLFKPITKYVRHRTILKRASPDLFTVISRNENEELLYTSGEVLELTLLSVKIRGYQVQDRFNKNGSFELKLFKIINITERKSPPWVRL